RQQRSATADDLLLVPIRLAGVLLGEEIEVGLAEGLGGIGQAEAVGHAAIDAEEAALQVLEIDGIGHLVHEHLQQGMLINRHHGFLPLHGDHTATGSTIVNVVPWPGALAASTVPPCMCTNARTRLRPRPKPRRPNSNCPEECRDTSISVKNGSK